MVDIIVAPLAEREAYTRFVDSGTLAARSDPTLALWGAHLVLAH